MTRYERKRSQDEAYSDYIIELFHERDEKKEEGFMLSIIGFLIALLVFAFISITAFPLRAEMITEQEYDILLDKEYGKGFAEKMHKKTYANIRREYGPEEKVFADSRARE